MTFRFPRAVRSILLTGFLASMSFGAELKTRPWPLTDKAYSPIDIATVRVERYLTESSWLRQTANRNPEISQTLQLAPVATIEVHRLYDEDEIDSLDPLIERAKVCAAGLGANAVFVTQNLYSGTELDGIQLMAYRAEYKGRLIPPTYIIALAQIEVPVSVMKEQVQDWDDRHFGTPIPLAHMKTGARVRVLLRDGSDFRGTFNGLDEDQRLWVQPSGWLGFFHDRAIPASDVRSVALVR